ncbi:MAG TPA: hypothetical protein VLE73_06020 [Candidatus Saccharimonadales bacterium]|nr:hypothetical protein [Candidatus Saccharimonadales bacterium]
MSLSNNDLQAIREIIKGEVNGIIRSTIKEELRPISGELEALRNDIKEIYSMISNLSGKTLPDEQFQKLSIEEKLLRLNSELLAAAQQAGITLPR